MIPDRSEPRERTAPRWVKVLVVLHLFAITVWSIPVPRAEIRSGQVQPKFTDWALYYNWKYLRTNPLIFDYLLSTGMWQYWDMFAPNPASADFYGDAVVTYRDGAQTVWNYTRIEKLPIPLKFVNERYRKFFERVRKEPGADEDYSNTWPVFAQHVAELNYMDPKNPPVRIQLRRNWIEIQPPGRAQWKDYQSFIFYTYEVDQKALIEAKEVR